jgi:hypothetical protein
VAEPRSGTVEFDRARGEGESAATAAAGKSVGMTFATQRKEVVAIT